MDEKLDMSQQYALTMQKTNCILGGTKTGAASRAREAILLLTLTSQGHTWSTAYRYSLIVIKEKGFKLKEERSRTDFRGKCLTRKEVRHWNRLFREAVTAPSLEVFKARLVGAPGRLI